MHLGLLCVVASIIGIIMFFIMTDSQSCETQELATTINDAFELSILGTMLVCTVWVSAMNG